MKDNGEILKFADEIIYMCFPCEKLSILEKNNELYIETHSKNNLNLYTYRNSDEFINALKTSKNQTETIIEYDKRFFIRKKVDKNKLLNSLISLRQKISHIDININSLSSYTTNDLLIPLEKQLSKDDIKLIINWCKKYGLPFLGDPSIHFISDKVNIYETYKYFGFENELLSCYEDSKTYFRVGTFLVGLEILFRTFIYAININNKIKLNVDIDTKNLPIVKGDKEALISFINTAFKSAPIHFYIDFSNEKNLKYNLLTETALSVALYHLALSIISPNPNLRAIRCDNCNNICLSSRANSVYCISCDRTTRYRQAHGIGKKNQKGESENGKHNKKKK